jgi:glycosyltransferase involved in cell wall biosynthesis
MSNAHIFAMPTRRDAEPLVFWEAMANGCALLVPNTSPHREFFGDFAQCVQPDNVDEISAAVGRFIDEVEFARGCASRGRQTFIERFHHSVVGKQYWELFRKVADNERTS